VSLTAASRYRDGHVGRKPLNTQSPVAPKRCEGGSAPDFFPSLGSVHRGGDAFPFRCQASKIVGHSGEIAIDRSGMAARCVSRRIFQRRGQFLLLPFQYGELHFDFA
jgi:hypothetical protein